MQAKTIRQYMKILGIAISDEKGYCYGLASVERNAFLLKDSEYTRHRQRMNCMTIHDFTEQFEQFVGHEKFGSHAEEIAQDDLKKWPVLLGYAATYFDKPINQITGADLYQIYLEIRGLLEVVAISQRPDCYFPLFNKPGIFQGDNCTILFTQSQLAEQQGGIHCIDQITNIYSNEAMASYLTHLGSLITQGRFSMILSDEQHAIMLAYDAQAQEWNVSNNASSIPFAKDNISGLTRELWSCFPDSSANKDLLLTMELYVPDSIREQVQSSQRLFFTSNTYKTIRQETYNKATLLEKGAKLLSIEASYGNAQAVQELLKHCSSIDILSSDFKALHLAAKNGHTETVCVLLKHGCNKDNVFSGKTALYMAAENGYEKIVHSLLKYNCKKNVTCLSDDDGTALHTAVKNGYEKVVSALLEGGCNPNIKNCWGNTALHVAVQNGNEKIVQILLEHGCKKNIKNLAKEIPLDLAVREGHDKIVQLFTYAELTTQKANLVTQLEIIFIKERELRKNGYKKAADCAKELYDTMQSNVNDFYTNKVIDIETFKQNCSDAITKARPELEKHRGWKNVLTNLARIIGLNVIHKLITGKNLFLFKPKTDSAKKVDALEQAAMETKISSAPAA